jgi:hypothetical protein
MKVLIGCERFGRVRDAFIARGHDAWSCDLLPSAVGGPHLQEDVREAIQGEWDLGIFFPDCTYLCVSGLHWNKRRPEREQLTQKAMDFAIGLFGADIPMIAMENPIGCLSTRWKKPSQIIQPWQFGEPESKATCLWLHRLPLLEPTNILPLPDSGRWANQTPSGQNKLGPSPDRAAIRGITYQGIADAMAEQWG